MKYNSDLIRKILMKIKETSFGETTIVSKLQELMPEVSMEEIIATVTLLNRERFIMIVGKPGYDDDDVFRDNKIRSLTERGYRTLDIIGDDKIWNLMKEKMPNFNDLSIFTIIVIANKIKNKEISEIFDLPNEYYTDYTRW